MSLHLKNPRFRGIEDVVYGGETCQKLLTVTSTDMGNFRSN